MEGQSSRDANHMLRSSASPLVEVDSGWTAFLYNDDDTPERYRSFFGNDDNILNSDFRLVDEFSKLSEPLCEGFSKECKLFILFKI